MFLETIIEKTCFLFHLLLSILFCNLQGADYFHFLLPNIPIDSYWFAFFFFFLSLGAEKNRKINYNDGCRSRSVNCTDS